MRVLVTGVAGFIGSATARLLVQQGYEVLGIDNLTSGTERSIPPGVNFFFGDIADVNLHQTIGEVDACIHFAGRIEAGESMRFPARFLVENVAKSQILFESLLSRGCDTFVFSSSAAVYGEGILTTLRESDPLSPTNPYGFSKLCVEQSLQWLHELSGIKYASLRFFNAAGAANNVAESHKPETHLIPLLLYSIDKTDDTFTVFGSDYPTPDGTCVRDYVHVSDLARAHVLALQYLKEEDHLIVNLGSGQGHSVLQVIQTVEKVTGREIKYQFSDRRKGDPPILIANIELAQKRLSWKPMESRLDQIVEDVWNVHNHK